MLDLAIVKFVEPNMVLWFVILPVVVGFSCFHIYRKNQFREQAGYGDSLRRLSSFTTTRSDKFAVVTIALVALILAFSLLRPQLRIEQITPEYEKQDLILILDRSVSMQATDISPSRFTGAIREIKSFLLSKPDAINRIGLIGFAGTSVVLSHLTSDLDAMFFFLDWISEDNNIYFGTNFSGAISSALEMVDKDDTDSNKTFLLLSDGDDESTELFEYLNQLNDAGIKVHTIGIGSNESVPMPLFSGGDAIEFLTDEEGNQLFTRFNESTMRQVAAMTNGTFLRSETGHDLSESLNSIVTGDLELLGYQRLVDYRDIYVPLVLTAVFLCWIFLIRI
jgi:Ca-activated chloride channel family protein